MQHENGIEAEAGIRRLVGMADLCELMAATFAYPENDELAQALADGSYAHDLAASLADAGAQPHDVNDAVGQLACFEDASPTSAYEWLRKGHSILFLAPGGATPVWPYEAAFKFTAAGREGEPALFRSPVTLDVEQHMKEAGVQTEDRLASPADSIWSEFSFMAYLLGGAAQAAYADDAPRCEEALERARSFAEVHLLTWAGDFFRRTIDFCQREERPFGRYYESLCTVALGTLDIVASGLSEQPR